MIQVVAAAIFRENRLLACKRAQSLDLAGFWEFPGGKVEADETEVEALKRELFEELGINVTISELISTSHDKDRDIALEIYVSKTSDEPTLSTAHDEIRWLTIQELDKIAWAPLDQQAVEYLKNKENKEYWGYS